VLTLFCAWPIQTEGSSALEAVVLLIERASVLVPLALIAPRVGMLTLLGTLPLQKESPGVLKVVALWRG
jgi:hypothetical protein